MKLKNTNNEKPKRPPTETKDQHLQSPPPLFELSGLRPPLPPQTVGPSSPTYTSSAEEDRRGTAPPSTAAAAAAPCHSLFSPTDEGRRHAPCGPVVPLALVLALLLEDGCRHALCRAVVTNEDTIAVLQQWGLSHVRSAGNSRANGYATPKLYVGQTYSLSQNGYGRQKLRDPAPP